MLVIITVIISVSLIVKVYGLGEPLKIPCSEAREIHGKDEITVKECQEVGEILFLEKPTRIDCEDAIKHCGATLIEDINEKTKN
jgi:hypothetical protein